MTVLVTGGLGYLGSRLVRELADDPEFSGEPIRILDNLRQPRYHALWDLPSYADYQFIQTDIRDGEAVRSAMEDVTTVFHTAAITNAPETFEIEKKTWEVNHDAALTVFEAARDAGVKEFVNLSTCSVYGTTEREITEEFECDPESPYGEAKLTAEREMLDRYDGRMGFTALRLGTVYGWTTGMRFDTVINKFAFLAAAGHDLTVYEGAESQFRPYLHVKDAVRSMLFAARSLGDGEPYNVVGQNASLREVIDAIKRHFVDVDITFTEAKNLNQLSYIVSDEKICNRGFDTTYTIDQGVVELADKFRAITEMDQA